jgi:hypothetical protein
MQVVSDPIGKPKVHFEAPPAKIMTAEMNRLLTWFNRTSPNGPQPLPALARAGIAHLTLSPFIHSKTATGGLDGHCRKKHYLNVSANRR